MTPTRGPAGPQFVAQSPAPPTSTSGLPWSRVYLYTGANDSAPHKPIGDLVSRASFVMPEPNRQPPYARLVIEEPRLSDEALYKCDVTYVKGKCPSISLVRVQMMALPERAQLFQVQGDPPKRSSGSQQLQPLAGGQLIGPLNEHDQLRLVCVVAGGKPAPRAVFWRKIDLTGRTINLTPGASAFPASEQRTPLPLTRATNAVGSQPESQVIEVALNHTLTSGDLGAKFECHVEHEALESFRPAARIISATTNHNSQQRPSSAAQPDALLDLHPAQSSLSSSIARHDENNESGEAMGDSEPGRPSGAATHPLDAHVIIDLNVGVQSLDLFLSKLSSNQAAAQSEPSAAAVAAAALPTATTSGMAQPTGARQRTGEPSSPLREGDLIELECVAYNSKPAANITWLNGSDVIGNGGASAASVESDAETGSTRRSIVVERRLEGSAAWANQPVTTSTTRSQRNRRLLQRNHMQLNANGQTYNTHSFLSIKLSRHEHGAQITCQARNGAMRSEPLVKTIELQVQHAPIVLMEPAAGFTVAEYELPPVQQSQRTNSMNNNVITSERTASSNAANAAEQVQIYCIYSANPLRLIAGTTRWFKDGQPLAIVGDRLSESITSNGYPMLTIKRVNRHDAGKYDCQLTNSIGTSERLAASEASKLEVNFRPSVQLRLYKSGSDHELDLEQALVMPGDELELACEVLEALPSKIDKFHWFTISGRPSTGSNFRPLTNNDHGQRLKLGPLATNFTLTSFACAAINSIGQSELSNTVELELSHTPGPSFVRTVTSPRVRKLILGAGKAALLQPEQPGGRLAQISEPNEESSSVPLSGRPLLAGKELLLECVTQTLGQPRANLWLWFKNGQTIDDTQTPPNARQDEEASADLRDNPISDRLQQDLSSAAAAAATNNKDRQRPVNRLLASGRYLFIPAIQLAHKGNYSCVAVNRLGSGGSGASPNAGGQSGTPANEGRDSYQLRVASAPSFVQPLASKTHWAETQTAGGEPHSAARAKQLELVCHVQCEPICQIEWLRNNELLDIKNGGSSGSANQAGNNIHFGYHVRHTIMEENAEADLFRSVESRLTLEFADLDTQPARQDKRPPLIDRDRLLARRHFLNSSNFTCQSGPNSMGPPVRSTTRLVVQYPPENVLISAPSDKLNLVEGSNGPLLGCEASGEPQVQYRWLLLRGAANNIITSSDLVAARYNVKHFANATSSSGRQQDARRSAPMARSNDVASERAPIDGPAEAPLDAGERLVELTGASSGEQVGGTSMATLDLSSISIDRTQAGHYICEASNALGQTRQSVYVNVLYKPTCTTLHMHSLDIAALTRDGRRLAETPTDLVLTSKPVGAGKNEEYSIVRETSEDFIGLRRVLVMSPLLAGGDLERFSFRGSIFGSSLESAASAASKRLPIREQEAALIHNSDPSKDDPAAARSNNLIASSDFSRPVESLIESATTRDETTQKTTADSWAKFNEILLKYLNDYSRHIEQDEERRIATNRGLGRSMADAGRFNQQQTTRRSASTSPRPEQDSDSNELGEGPTAPSGGTRHEERRYLQSQNGGARRTSLLTFACMAREGNPMTNLTFDWYFGAVRLLPPGSGGGGDTIDNSLADSRNQYAAASGAHQRQSGVIYSNENETLSIMLARRLDSGAALNPFQMSFLTVNVVVVVAATNDAAGGKTNPNDDADELQSRSSSLHTTSDPNNSMQLKAPVIKSRYQSFYGNLQASAADSSAGGSSRRRSSSNIMQFDEHHHQHHQADIELNEHNWQDRLGQLLSCSVSNSVGTSEACYVRVSTPLDRAKSGSSNGLAGSSSLYEFAKWRMPSLAQKSLLIISVLIGCSLIVFATFALLVGPHLRAMQLLQKRPDSGASSSTSKDDQNTMHTGQSTGSQKSSVLGLLGNGGDSFPSSSDDDTSGRLNQLECNGGATQRCHQSGRMLEMDANELSPDDRLLGSGGGGSGHQLDYDLPRSATANNMAQLQRPRLVYQPDVGNFNYHTGGAAYENYHFQQHHHEHHQPSIQSSSLANQQTGKHAASASSRILASLKSKFKVQDRISDLPISRWSALHNRNVSNSETATTGISVSGLDNMSLANGNATQANTTSRTMLHHLGVPVNLRHSYAGSRPQLRRPHQAYQPMTLSKPPSRSYYAASSQLDPTNASLDDATYNRLLQLNSQVFINQQSGGNPREGNQSELPNAMDEFMRSRGLVDTAGAFDRNHPQDGDSQLAPNYGSQSIRNQSSALYALRNDLTSLTKPKVKPPVHPRTTANAHPYGLTSARHPAQSGYHISAAVFKPSPAPPIAARASQREPMFGRQSISGLIAQSGLYPMTGGAPFGESDIMPGAQYATANRFDTIDSHLNRLPESVAMGYYNNQEQIAYANALEISNPYAHQSHYDNSQLANANNQSAEHIYDLNAYATPEQTPLRGSVAAEKNHLSNSESERLRVSQLIQTFNTKHPDQPTS